MVWSCSVQRESSVDKRSGGGSSKERDFEGYRRENTRATRKAYDLLIWLKNNKENEKEYLVRFRR